MFNVRLKNVRFLRPGIIGHWSLVILILLDATVNAHVLRRNRREIIDSDVVHANGSILPSPTSSETIADDLSIDGVHFLESHNNNNDKRRVGVVDISNTSSNTTSTLSQNDIITSNLNGSTTSPSALTTLVPSSTTDVNNAIAMDFLDENHPDHQREYDGPRKSSQTKDISRQSNSTGMRLPVNSDEKKVVTGSTIKSHSRDETTSTSASTAIPEAIIASSASTTSAAPTTMVSNWTADRSKNESRPHEIHADNVTDKRGKFLVDTSGDFASTTIQSSKHLEPSWTELKNVGEVIHNNVTFSKAADADIAVVKYETKLEKVSSPNVENGSTESISNAGIVAVETQKQMFDQKLNRNSSHIDDSVHQDISVNVLPAVTPSSSTTISAATMTSASTPKMTMAMPHTTEREYSPPTTLSRVIDEIEVHLLATTEEQLTTTTEHPLYDTTFMDESIAIINTLKPNETEKMLLPIDEESTRITESLPDSTISITTMTPSEKIDQSTVGRATVHATEAVTEMMTSTTAELITTIDAIPLIPRTSTVEPNHETLTPTTENGSNKVDIQSEHNINIETTGYGNEIETTERETHRMADIKSTTFAETTWKQIPIAPLFVPTTTSTEASTSSASTITMTTSTSSSTTATTTTTTAALNTTHSTSMATSMETPLPEETPNYPGVGGGIHPDAETPDVNAIIAITISIVSVVTLILLVGFLIVMRKRQKQLSYAQRCRPLGLDDAYSLDNISVYNSVRRKSTMRTSKRAYGNAAFDDPALKNNLLTISQLAAFAQKRTSIYEEFRDVPLVTARIDEVPAGCEDKNRYANVVPLPESRVHLQQFDDDETTEYINANFVKGPKDTSHYYIACQAPMENTIIDFWRMIWEQNSRVIIMATDLTENGIEKCAEYLPPSFVIDNHVTFGDFNITLKNREVRDKYAVSTVHLKNVQTKTWREVTHLWYQWPETGTPSDETSVIAMLLEARSYMKMATPEQTTAGTTNTAFVADDDNDVKHKSGDLDVKIANGNSDKSKSLLRIQGPLTVHCSPGTGRTGTIIACDVAIRTLEQPARSVDIPQIVYCVRRGRASAVQTREQYEFIYKVSQMYATKLTGLNNEN